RPEETCRRKRGRSDDRPSCSRVHDFLSPQLTWAAGAIANGVMPKSKTLVQSGFDCGADWPCPALPIRTPENSQVGLSYRLGFVGVQEIGQTLENLFFSALVPLIGVVETRVKNLTPSRITQFSLRLFAFR
ncbi:MAG: hypothetical protein WB777_04645, partial [Mycobacterium sp.]